MRNATHIFPVYTCIKRLSGICYSYCCKMTIFFTCLIVFIDNFSPKLHEEIECICESWQRIVRVLSVIGKLLFIVFFAAQTSSAFRSAHILLHFNLSNDYVVTEKNPITLS